MFYNLRANSHVGDTGLSVSLLGVALHPISEQVEFGGGRGWATSNGGPLMRLLAAVLGWYEVRRFARQAVPLSGAVRRHCD